MSLGCKFGPIETRSLPYIPKKEGGERSQENGEEEREKDVPTEQAWPQEPVLLLQGRDLPLTGPRRAD